MLYIPDKTVKNDKKRIQMQKLIDPGFIDKKCIVYITNFKIALFVT